MSYILDALRRAEAERARGSVPGLHSAETGLPAVGEPDGRWHRHALAWAVLALLTLGGTAGLAWWLGRGAAQPAAAGAPQTRVLAAPAQAAARGQATDQGAGEAGRATPAGPSPVQQPSLPSTAGQAPAYAQRAPGAAVPAPAPVPVPVPVPAPAAPVRQAEPPAAAPVPAPRPPSKVAVPRPAAPATALPPRPGPTLPPPTLPPPATSPPAVTAKARPSPPLQAGTPVPSLADLPQAWRAQLPALSLAGGMYAESPAQRLVILNGQVAREGDTLADGLRLEQIRPRSVVFSLRGQRFEVPM